MYIGSDNTKNSDVMRLKRYSIEANTLSEIIATIDDRIANKKFLCFYTHMNNIGNVYKDETYTIEKLEYVINYCIEKYKNGEIMLDTPDNCFNYYYQ